MFRAVSGIRMRLDRPDRDYLPRSGPKADLPWCSLLWNGLGIRLRRLFAEVKIKPLAADDGPRWLPAGAPSACARPRWPAETTL
jgi:hypothetical protein